MYKPSVPVAGLVLAGCDSSEDDRPLERGQDVRLWRVGVAVLVVAVVGVYLFHRTPKQSGDAQACEKYFIVGLALNEVSNESAAGTLTTERASAILGSSVATLQGAELRASPEMSDALAKLSSGIGTIQAGTPNWPGIAESVAALDKLCPS